MKKVRSFITTRDFIIPKGTILNELDGCLSAVLVITSDSVAYFNMERCDIECSKGFAIPTGEKETK